MANEPLPLFEELRSKLVGHRVTFRRLACASLLIYVECTPGDGRGITIWFEPTWHFRGPDGVLLGSDQAWEARDSNESLDSVSMPLNILHDGAVEDVVVESSTHDLTVTFEGGFLVRTFVSDATAEQSWHIRENATGTRLVGSPGGLSRVEGRR